MHLIKILLSSSLLPSVLLILFMVPAHAQTDTQGTQGSSGLELLSFRAGFLGVFQQMSAGSGSTFTGTISHQPGYWVTSDLRVGINLGFTPLKVLVKGASQLSLGVEYNVDARYHFTREIFGEIGVGAQTWLTQGTAPQLNLVAGYRFGERWMGFLDHLGIGYSMAFFPSLNTHLLRVIAGICF